jgi:hypothetical protein
MPDPNGAGPREIDYTAMRKRTWIGNQQVGVCPKCGRKGLMQWAYVAASGRAYPTLVRHKVLDTGITELTTQSCILNDRPQVPAAGRR